MVDPTTRFPSPPHEPVNVGESTLTTWKFPRVNARAPVQDGEITLCDALTGGLAADQMVSLSSRWNDGAGINDDAPPWGKVGFVHLICLKEEVAGDERWANIALHPSLVFASRTHSHEAHFIAAVYGLDHPLAYQRAYRMLAEALGVKPQRSGYQPGKWNCLASGRTLTRAGCAPSLSFLDPCAAEIREKSGAQVPRHMGANKC